MVARGEMALLGNCVAASLGLCVGGVRVLLVERFLGCGGVGAWVEGFGVLGRAQDERWGDGCGGRGERRRDCLAR